MQPRFSVLVATAMVGIGLAGCSEFTFGINDRPNNAVGSMLNNNPYSSSDNPVLSGEANEDHPTWFGGSSY